MADGRTKLATIQKSDEGLSVGVRLRVALDLLETLSEAGVALAPRGAKSKLRFDRVEIDEEGQSSVGGSGDATGAAQLVWEVVAGKMATWSGTATDDDLPEDVPGPVIDLLGGLLGESGKAGDLAEKLEEASRGFVDTHDDVRSAVGSWRDSHEDESAAAAPAPPPPAPAAAKPAPAPPPKAAPPPPEPPKAEAPKPEPAKIEAVPKPEPVKVAAPKAEPPKVEAKPPVVAEVPKAEPPKVEPKVEPQPAAKLEPTPKAAETKPEPTPTPVEAKPVEPKPVEPKIEATPPAGKIEAKKVGARGLSELPEWDDAPLSAQLDRALEDEPLPPVESLTPVAQPAPAPAYPVVPPAPRTPSFPDTDIASIEKKPGRPAPPNQAAPPPPAGKRAPQPTVPETRAARSFIETVPPTANILAPVAAAPAAMLAQAPVAAPVAAKAAPAPVAAPAAQATNATQEVAAPARQPPRAPPAAPPPPARGPTKTDPLRQRPPPRFDAKRTEPMWRPEANGAGPGPLVPAAGKAPTAPATSPAPADDEDEAPRLSDPMFDVKETMPFRRRLPGPHDPGGDDAPTKGPLSSPPLPDAASAATDGAIPLPKQAPAPSMPAAKVILEGGERKRAQMDTEYTRRPEVTFPVAPADAVGVARQPDFEIPIPVRKSRTAVIAIVVVAALGGGLFALLASQMTGPPEMTPTPTVTAPSPPPPPSTAAEATPPPPAETAAAPAEPPTQTAAAEVPAPPTPHGPNGRPRPSATPTTRASSGNRTPPKKWQPNLPDHL